MAYFLLKLLHVLSMAAWLAAALWIPGDVKRTVASGGDPAALRGRVRPALALDVAAGLSTVVTGAVLLVLHGLPLRTGLEAGAALGLLLLALVAGGIRPAWKRVESALAAGDREAAAAGARRLSALAGVGHLLWLATLSLMVLPV
ncbi:MAG TPA: hypothetical protein VLS93_05475 [Anaeromyxobacteraceae bacterium]|nr:hypothetical protein [Anaeromyxobacteraceae bacterium]